MIKMTQDMEEILRYVPRFVTKEDFDELKRLEGFEIYRRKNKIGGCSELYTKARKFAFQFLLGLDFLDKELCKEYGIDYLDVLCDRNLIKIMTAYHKMQEEKIYEIYRKIHRRRRIK